MATATFSLKPACYISATFTEVATNTANNTSTFRANFSVVGNNATWSSDTLDAVIQFYYKVDGGSPQYLTNATFTYDFRSNNNPTYLTNYDVVITHRANGSQTVVFGATARDGNTGNARTIGIATIGDTSVTVTDLTRVPTAPGSFLATRPKSGTAATGETIRLSWNASTAPSGSPTSAISYYEYQNKVYGAGSWDTAVNVGNVTAADFTGVSGTAYQFQIRAFATNSDGYGAYSGPITAYAAPSITSVTAVGTTASVTVAAPSSNGGSTISSYSIDYSTDAGFGVFQTSTLASPGTATITGLTPGNTYYFRAKYVNAASVTSPYTANSSVFIAAYGRRYIVSGAITNVTTTSVAKTITTLAADNTVTPPYTIFNVASTAGITIGDSIVVTGIAAPNAGLNQTYTVTDLSSVSIFTQTATKKVDIFSSGNYGTVTRVGDATYTASNDFSAGDTVTITGVIPSAYNLTNATVKSATSTQFVITGTATGTFSSTGIASSWVRMLTGKRYAANDGSGSPGWVTIATAQKNTTGLGSGWSPFS